MASHKPDDQHKDDRNDPKDDQPKDNTDGNSDSTPFSELVWNNMGPNAQKLYPNCRPVEKGAGAVAPENAAGVFDNILASVEGHISVCSNIPIRMASPLAVCHR